MNNHDARTISFHLLGEKNNNFPIIWAKKENSNTEIEESFIIKTMLYLVLHRNGQNSESKKQD